jgi:hypothetical protein
MNGRSCAVINRMQRLCFVARLLEGEKMAGLRVAAWPLQERTVGHARRPRRARIRKECATRELITHRD